MSEKVDRCKSFLRTGLQKKVPSLEECKVCPLRNADGDCPKDISDDHCSAMEAAIGDIWCDYWRDYFEKRTSRQPR